MTIKLRCLKSYWPDEPVIYRPKVEEHIDIICSHSAPSFCYPNDKGGIVKDFAAYDSELLNDIDNERAVLDRVYEDYKNEVTHWYYGHFHQSWHSAIDGILYQMLDIMEFSQVY